MYQIYAAYCEPSNKVYVGQTCVGLKRRWSLHKSRANRGYKLHLYNALRKYGAESFGLQELASVETREQTDNLERLWILLLDSTNPEVGYNNTFGGEGGKKTPESIEKQRQKMLGRKLTPEQKRKQGESIKKAWDEGRMTGMRGKKLPESVREKHRRRMSGEKHFAYRHDVSVEDLLASCKEGLCRKEIADRFSIHPDTVTKRLKTANVPYYYAPYKHSEETRKKIGDAFRGKKLSPEFCAKTSAGLKVSWAKRKGLLNGSSG